MSTLLYTGNILNFIFNSFISSSLKLVKSDIRLSEKPIDLILRKIKLFIGTDLFWSVFSTSIIPYIWFKNHLSQPVILATSLIDMLFLKAHAILKIRSGTCLANQPEIVSVWLSLSLLVGRGISSNPLRPVSRDLKAFCKDSWKDLPIAITSPTDLIDVESNPSLPGNFSKVKRGILVTT